MVPTLRVHLRASSAGRRYAGGPSVKSKAPEGAFSLMAVLDDHGLMVIVAPALANHFKSPA